MREIPQRGATADGYVVAREHAIRLLTDHYADGTVDDEEFELHLARLREASDTMAVEAMVAELDGARARSVAAAAPVRAPLRVPPRAARPAPAASPARPAPRHTALPPGEQRLLAVASEMKRRGWWEVPRFLRVRAIAADLELDLRDVVLPEGCTFDVGAYLAAVKIIVPPGTTVDFDVLPMLGTALNKAPAPGPVARLRVTGTAVMAEVKVIVREPGERKRRKWW